MVYSTQFLTCPLRVYVRHVSDSDTAFLVVCPNFLGADKSSGQLVKTHQHILDT